MQENDYFKVRSNISHDKLRENLRQLPSICNEYFMGIESTTSILTRLGYAQDLKIFFYFLTTEIYEFSEKSIKTFNYDDLSMVTVTHMEMFLSFLSHYFYNNNEYTNSVKTKSRKLASIKSFFKYNFNKDNIKSDPASKISTPKLLEKPIIRLEGDEIFNLLDEVACGDALTSKQSAFHKQTCLRDSAIITLFLGTGIRISELVGLNVDDIDFNINAFKVTRKGGNQTILYFPDEVAKTLLAYLDERSSNPQLDNIPALFLSLQNKRLCVRSIENLVKKYAQITTPLKNITPHKLRSTYGTNLYQETNDIYVVAEVLGHRDINTTKKHYAAISEQIKKNASQKVILTRQQTPESDE